jgi:hypothetical protein
MRSISRAMNLRRPCRRVSTSPRHRSVSKRGADRLVAGAPVRGQRSSPAARPPRAGAAMRRRRAGSSRGCDRPARRTRHVRNVAAKRGGARRALRSLRRLGRPRSGIGRRGQPVEHDRQELLHEARLARQPLGELAPGLCARHPRSQRAAVDPQRPGGSAPPLQRVEDRCEEQPLVDAAPADWCRAVRGLRTPRPRSCAASRINITRQTPTRRFRGQRVRLLLLPAGAGARPCAGRRTPARAFAVVMLDVARRAS